jgi:hypothetical protein
VPDGEHATQNNNNNNKNLGYLKPQQQVKVEFKFQTKRGY